MKPTLLLCLVAGCIDPVEDEDGCDPCALLDAHNYSWAPELVAPVFAATAGQDLWIDWSELSHDLLGHPIKNDRIDHATLAVFDGMAPQQVLEALAEDRLEQASLRIGLFCDPEGPGCHLSDFNLLGNGLDIQQYFQPGQDAWMVAPDIAGEPGAVGLVFLEPSGIVEVGEVQLHDGDSRLEAEVDLHSLLPLRVDLVAAPVVTWEEVTVDALGNEIAASRFDRLELARYDLGLGELEARFLDLELMEASRWSADVGGQSSYDLGLLPDFDGFTEGGTWLLALRCSSCTNPAPRFLTVVETGSP